MAAPQTPAPSSQPQQPAPNAPAAPRAPGRPGPKPGTPRPPRANAAPAGEGSAETGVGASEPAPARAAATGAASAPAAPASQAGGAAPASGPALRLAPEAGPSRRLGVTPKSLEQTHPATAAVMAAKPVSPRHAWWVGTLAGGPVHTTTIGGISFPRQTEIVGQDGDGQTTRSSRPGAIVYLTDEQVERVRKALPTKVVRSVKREDGTVSRAQVYDVRGTPDTPFTPSESDEPLARYVFMQRVPEFDHAAE